MILNIFRAFFESKKLNDNNLEIYKSSLNKLSLSAQRRKISSANQYLLYLYQTMKVERFYKIEQVENIRSEKPSSHSIKYKEFPEFYGSLTSPGQLIALIILEFGLNFSEIGQLKWENFDWRFKVLTVEKNSLKRVLPIREKFALPTRGLTNADELFAKSRQFLYTELKKYTSCSSKELREQYILRQIRTGKNIYEIATLLGLSTTVTLEKYFK